MAKGWVYIITNKSMPGLIKIGYSMKDPALRAKELGHTGAPHSYEVEYEILVNDPHEIEQRVHSRLHEHREGKEWFRCSYDIAVAAIRIVSENDIYVENFKRIDKDNIEKSISIRESDAKEKQRHEKVQQEAEAKKWFDQAHLFFETKQWQLAINAYQQAINLRPNWTVALLNHGAACENNKELSRAIESYLQVIRIDPQYAKAWLYLGQAYGKEAKNKSRGFRGGVESMLWGTNNNWIANDKNKAIEAIKKATQIKPDYEEAWQSLGDICLFFELNNQAIDAFRHVVLISQMNASAWHKLGLCYIKALDFMKANDVYLKLKSLDTSLANDISSKVPFLERLRVSWRS